MKHFELWNEIRPDEKRNKEILEEILSPLEVMEMKKRIQKDSVPLLPLLYFFLA